jgi:hypothetical protein
VIAYAKSFGFFTEGNSEGFREQAKRTKIFAAAEDKAFVSFACSRKLSELSSI